MAERLLDLQQLQDMLVLLWMKLDADRIILIIHYLLLITSRTRPRVAVALSGD
jgi:hypothetical protein